MSEYTDVEILELKQKEKESIKPEELFFEDKRIKSKNYSDSTNKKN